MVQYQSVKHKNHQALFLGGAEFPRKSYKDFESVHRISGILVPKILSIVLRTAAPPSRRFTDLGEVYGLCFLSEGYRTIVV